MTNTTDDNGEHIAAAILAAAQHGLTHGNGVRVTTHGETIRIEITPDLPAGVLETDRPYPDPGP